MQKIAGFTQYIDAEVGGGGGGNTDPGNTLVMLQYVAGLYTIHQCTKQRASHNALMQKWGGGGNTDPGNTLLMLQEATRGLSLSPVLCCLLHRLQPLQLLINALLSVHGRHIQQSASMEKQRFWQRHTWQRHRAVSLCCCGAAALVSSWNVYILTGMPIL